MDWSRARTRPAARRARTAGLVLLAIVAGALGSVFVVPLAARAMVSLVLWLFDASVSTALSMSGGASPWGVVGTVGRAAASSMLTGPVSTVIAALVLIAATALYGLQRLLGSNRGSKE